MKQACEKLVRFYNTYTNRKDVLFVVIFFSFLYVILLLHEWSSNIYKIIINFKVEKEKLRDQYKEQLFEYMCKYEGISDVTGRKRVIIR